MEEEEEEEVEEDEEEDEEWSVGLFGVVEWRELSGGRIEKLAGDELEEGANEFVRVPKEEETECD